MVLRSRPVQTPDSSCGLNADAVAASPFGATDCRSLCAHRADENARMALKRKVNRINLLRMFTPLLGLLHLDASGEFDPPRRRLQRSETRFTGCLIPLMFSRHASAVKIAGFAVPVWGLVPFHLRGDVRRGRHCKGFAAFPAPDTARSYSARVNAARVVEPPGPGFSVMRIAVCGVNQSSRCARYRAP